MRKTLWIPFAFLLCTGCVTPRYDQQYVEIPPTWRLETDESTTLCNMRWWEQFDDPVLNQLIETALRNNLDIQVAISRVLQFYDEYRIVSASLYPTITAAGSYDRARPSQAIPFSSGPGIPSVLNNYLATVNLSWELDFWGRVKSASMAACAELFAQVNNRRAIVISIVSAVADTYITLRQLDAQLTISRETLATRQESFRLSNSRFELGETSELEVWQSLSAVEDAMIRVITYERQIPLQENLLSILLGEPPQGIPRGEPLRQFHYPVSVPAGLPSDLLTRRPDIMEAEYQLIAANARVGEARALYFPQMQLTAKYGNESIALSNFLSSPATLWAYGVSAVQTLYDTGRIYYTVQEAKDERDEALFAYRQVILNAFKEVNDALIACKKNQELVVEHEKQVAVLAEYYRMAYLRFLEGEVDYLNVLDAERQLFASELAWVEAERDNYTAVVALYKALGGGWVIDADQMALYE